MLGANAMVAAAVLPVTLRQEANDKTSKHLVSCQIGKDIDKLKSRSE